MTQEEKRTAFLKRAHDNKENFELHRTLIAKYIDEKPNDKLLLSLIAYAEKYHESKVKNFSSNLPVMRSLPSVEELRKIAEDRPDTFLTGALYIIDLVEGGNGA